MNILSQLKQYVAEHILDGEDIGLDAQTPLREWGLMNSMEVVRLIAFIQKTYLVEIQFSEMTEVNFSTLAAVAALVQKHMDTSAQAKDPA